MVYVNWCEQVSVEDNIGDALFVMDYENRKKILSYLRDKNDYVSSREISKSLETKMGDVSFYCGQLLERKIVEKMIVSHRARWKITEKGVQVMQEVDKREGAKKIKKK